MCLFVLDLNMVLFKSRYLLICALVIYQYTLVSALTRLVSWMWKQYTFYCYLCHSSIQCLFPKIIGPITHITVQTNYRIALTRGIQFVYKSWCIIGPGISKVSASNNLIFFISFLDSVLFFASNPY